MGLGIYELGVIVVLGILLLGAPAALGFMFGYWAGKNRGATVPDADVPAQAPDAQLAADTDTDEETTG